MKTHEHNNEICQIPSPLEWTKEKNQLFVKACKEMALFHYEHSEDLRKLYDKRNFDPSSLETLEDLNHLPSIGVTAMKYHLLTSRSAKEAVLKLTSSGTSGQKTQIWFDEGSLSRVQRMLDVLLEEEGLVSQEKANYLVFNYDAEKAGDLGTAYTQKNQLRFAPANKVQYAIVKDENDEWFFDKPRALKILEEYQKETLPVRILGMPAFLFDFIEFLGEKSFSFGQKSVMIFGGGWKAREDKKVTKEEFRTLCSTKLGIPSHRIRDAFGLAEHSAPYFECSHHKFHVPVFNRLLTRDPVTMEVTAPGEKGLLQLITPFNSMMPTLSILSTDWAVIDKGPCSCKKNSPTFQILGRAGISKHKGCALQAEEILKRKKS